MDIVAKLKELVTAFDETAEPAGETIVEVLDELVDAVEAYITAAAK